MRCVVTRDVLSRLLEEARSAYPLEACGILLGEGLHIVQAHPTRNIHPNPKTHFEIDPQALIDAQRAARRGGPQVVGYYHSHPHGPPEPSVTDREMAAGDNRVWAIVGEGRVAFWRDGDDGFTALSYALVDR